MTTRIYALETLKEYKYVVILSKYDNKILLSRHKLRSTWETQGGHIEAGESPIDAARRELFEESGAIDFELEPLCDYWAGNELTGEGTNGMVFRVVIHTLGNLPESEMAETKGFDTLPDNLTYPEITPTLFQYLFKHSP